MNTVNRPQSPETALLGANLRSAYSRLGSWPKVARSFPVLTADGRPDPGLAWRIAVGNYEPKSVAIRRRLGLPDVCSTCLQPIRRRRVVPAWVSRGAAELRRMEQLAAPVLTGSVYSRKGKRVT